MIAFSLTIINFRAIHNFLKLFQLNARVKGHTRIV